MAVFFLGGVYFYYYDSNNVLGESQTYLNVF